MKNSNSKDTANPSRDLRADFDKFSSALKKLLSTPKSAIPAKPKH